MSDMWAFPSCSSPPIMQQVQVRNHGNQHHPQVSSPQFLPPALENPNWTHSQFPSMPSGYSYCDQNQNLELDLQLQTQFGCDPLCFSEPQCVLGPGPHLDPWGPLELELHPQDQSCGPGSAPGAWSSTHFSHGLAHSFYSGLSEFYPDSYHDDGNIQPYCSPSTPGPSPHYPQAPFVSSPGPGISPAFRTQDTTFSFPTTLDPSHHHPLALQAGAGPGWSTGGGGVDGSVGSSVDGSGIPDGSAGAQAAHASLPALNRQMRSHGSCQPASRANQNRGTPLPLPASMSMVMPVSVAVRSKRGGGCVQRRRSRAAPVGGAVLYSSLMHCLVSEEEEGGAGGYTPPPMLSPLRVGPGLYWSVSATSSGRPRPPAHRKQKNDSKTMTYDGSSHPITMETPPRSGTLTSGVNTPRINIGRDFQAEIPPLLDLKYVHSDSHNALLLWAPWAELEHAANQQRVEAMLMLTRSSVVPGGGASPEYALQLLSESRGDFLVTLEKLLSNPEPNDTKQRGGWWSLSESRSVVQSLQIHQKDFVSVQRDVQTKTLPQCVEFYYLWKKKLNLRTKTRTGLTLTLPNTNARPRPGPGVTPTLPNTNARPRPGLD